ncbi:MAG: hypothetical protein EOO11_10170 [Chitinophagaceae bacterium]|nr:MAG: hypothetical protein EOO11_10170 [Chitinophagaceae bacterium]
MLKPLLLSSVFILIAAGFTTGYAQTSPADCKAGCTSNDVQIRRAYLVDSATLQPLTGNVACSGSVKVKLALELTTNTPRVGVAVYANVKNFTGGVVGATLVPKKECFGTTLNQPTNKVVFSGAFSWACGMPIVLTDVFLGWGTGNTDFCQSNPAFRCPGTPSKCYSQPPGQYITIEIPMAKNAARSLCPDTVGRSTATFNLSALNGEVSNNAGNATITWYSNQGLTTAISTPGAYSTGSGTVYAKIANNADPTVYSTATVTLTVLSGPALSISNPAAVCAPANVSLSAAAVTAGSTLPAGTRLSYWTSADTSTAIGAPEAVGTGTYYIKANSNSSPSCVDIRPVTVTVHPKPTLSITAPAAVCAPATVDLRNAAVTSGSTLPAGTVLSYWTNAGATDSFATPGTAGNGTFYIKAQTSTVPACADIKSVLVTVRPTPVLSVTSPGAVCAPTTVSLTAAAVTAGSSLPAGTELSYWTNAAATTPVNTPGAVSSGTYYIKAAVGTAPTCADIEAVTVASNPRPDTAALCAVQPSMCGPATGTLTVLSPTGTSYQYSIDGGQHWQSGVTFSNIPAASNPAILVKNSAGCVSESATSCSKATTCAPAARTTAVPAGEEKRVQPAAKPADAETAVKVYPNPYRNTVSFIFTAPVSGKVSLEVYDNTGRQMAAISYGDVTAGTMRVLRYSPQQKISALQLYRLRIGSKTISGKMIQSE